LAGKDGHKSEEVSGIACTTDHGFPRACLVIDDDTQFAQFISMSDGELRAGDKVPLITDEFGKKPLSLDGEGVAYAGGAFYVVGSHGHPRDKERKLHPVADRDKINAGIAASSQVVRVRLKAGAGHPLTRDDVLDVRASPELRTIMAGEPSLARYLDRRLENNGLTIEGVAITGNRFFVGFRGPPLDNGRAPVLSVALAALFEGAAPQPVLYRLPVGDGRGIRDLAAYDDGILVLVGPVGSEAGLYSVYWWNAASESLRFLADITTVTRADEHRKPEALVPLDRSPFGLRILVLLDGPKEGEPHQLVIPAP
jgi:hypothetical protein